MQGTKLELQHNSPEQVRGILTLARQTCEDEYEGDSYPVEVLLKTIDLLAAKTIQFVQPQPVHLDAINLPQLGNGPGRR